MFCPHCGKEVAEGQPFCQHCGGGLAEPAPGPAPAEGGRAKTPWEDRGSIGFFKSYFSTVKNVLFHPTVFFRKMPVQGGLIDPLLFALITGMIGLMFFYFWDILLHDGMRSFMTPQMKAAAGQYPLQGIGAALLAFLAPLLILTGLFISSGILHLFLMMVNGARAGFEATFRVVAYGYSANIFSVVPVCGGLIVGVWTMVLAIIGFKEAHQTTGGKAAFAVFFPIIVCCGLVFIAALLFMGAVAASFGAMMQMYK